MQGPGLGLARLAGGLLRVPRGRGGAELPLLLERRHLARLRLRVRVRVRVRMRVRLRVRVKASARVSSPG